MINGEYSYNLGIIGGNANNGYDLTTTKIFGGSKDANVNGNTIITVLGGYVDSVYGGGMYGSVGGSTNITISSGEVDDVYGGGQDGSVGESTNITISSGKLLIVFGGRLRGGVTGTACLKVYADATVSKYISAGCLVDPLRTFGDNSFAECEVAFYDGVTKLKNPASQWVKIWEKGKFTNNTATEPEPLTCAGKIFRGWKKSDGAVNNFSTVITMPIKLYANWTYTVTYDGNGNSGGTVPMDNNTYASAANVPLEGNPGNLAKTGYTFGGWSLTPNGTAETSYIMATTPITFYAVWTLSNQGGNATSSSTNSGSLNTQAVMPFPANSNGTGSIVSQVQKAKDGESVDINMNGTTILKSEWLEAIAGKMLI